MAIQGSLALNPQSPSARRTAAAEHSGWGGGVKVPGPLPQGASASRTPGGRSPDSGELRLVPGKVETQILYLPAPIAKGEARGEARGGRQGAAAERFRANRRKVVWAASAAAVLDGSGSGAVAGDGRWPCLLFASLGSAGPPQKPALTASHAAS